MISEIPEHEATGDIARSYAEIRQRLGLPVVNLIWRHLAALGHLEESWQRVKTRLPALNAQAARLYHTARTLADRCPPLPSLPQGEKARGILASYERGNSMNLAMVRMVMGCAFTTEANPVLPDAPTSIPPVPRFSELPICLREIVDRLAAAGPGATTGIRPTMWVHLALEPDFLRAAEAPIAQLVALPDFRAAHAKLAALPPRPENTDLPKTMETALDRFNQRISEMLLTGLCLARCKQATMETRR